MATALILLLSACGAKATPTPDVQATAVAAASTMLALTQAAVPTETPVPPTEAPTETPQPTPTIPALPTNPVVVINPVLPSPTAVTSSSSGGGECSGPITADKGEVLATIAIVNRTKVLLGVSIYLQKNSWGDCGYWYAPTGVAAGSSITITSLPASNSCYHVNAYTLTGDPKFWNTADFCAASSTKYTLIVTAAGISMP